MINEKPDNNLIWAVLSTFFCCPATGIYAIIQATNVDRKWEDGDKLGAINAAEAAKKWSIYGIWALLVCLVLYVVFVFLFVSTAFSILDLILDR